MLENLSKRLVPYGRRAMAGLLALVLCLGMLPVSAFATEWQSTCPHDLGQHDETCGYTPATEGVPCGHTTHDDACGFAEAIPETACTCGAVAGEDGTIVHGADCAYTPATEGVPCKHTTHDDACGFTEAVAETPCAHMHDETCGGLPPEKPSVFTARAAPMLMAEYTGPISVYSNGIYAGGEALLITGTPGYATTIYIDANKNGALDTGELSLYDAGVYDAPSPGTDLSKWKIYGGERGSSTTGDTMITMTGGTVFAIYGGGNGVRVSVSGDTYVTMTGGTVTHGVYGGGFDGGVSGTCHVTIKDGTVGNVCGGSAQGETVGNNIVTIEGGKMSSVTTEYNSNASMVTGTPAIIITGGEISGNVSSAKGTVSVGGAAKIGKLNGNNSTGISIYLQNQFAITSPLTDAIVVALKYNYDATGNPVLATGAQESDLAKISLGGEGAVGKKAYFDSGTSTIKVRTVVQVSTVTLDPTTLEFTLDKTQTRQLKATVAPENAEDNAVTWRSSKASVATVDSSGLVTAVGKGTANIIATAGGVSGYCAVTVKLPPMPGTITVAPYTGTYDGLSHNMVTVTGAPEGSTTWYSTSSAGYTQNMPTRKDATDGSLVRVKVTHPDYEAFISEEQTVVINKASLTPTAIDMTDGMTREYDGTAVARGAKITLTGEVNNETPTATATITFDSADVGNNKTVSATDIALGTDAVSKNYTLSSTALSSQSSTAAITPKEVAVVWTVPKLTYTGVALNSQVTAKYVNVQNADVSLTVSFDKEFKNAGTYTATAAMTSVNNNYTLTGNTQSVTIGKASRTITLPAAASVTVTAVTLTAATLSAGDGAITYGYSTTNSINDASNWQAGLTFSGLASGTTYYFFAKVADGSNHLAATSSALTVQTPAKSLTGITVDMQPIKTEYQAFEAFDKDGMRITAHYDDNTSADITSYKVSYPDSRAYLLVGDNAVTITYGGKTVTQSVTVTKATGNGTVALAGWTYGGTKNAPVPTSATNGTDKVTYQYKVKGAADDTYSGTGPTNAGTYTVKATFAAVADYTAATAQADFTIAPKPLTEAMLTITGNYTYTGTAITPTYTVTDGSALTADDYTAGVTDNTNAGTAKVTITGKGNYSGEISKTFAIAKAPLTVTVKSPLTISKVYDGGTAVTTAVSDRLEVTGLKNGEIATASGAWAYDNKNVGSSKTLNITGIAITYGTATAGNYSYTQTALTASGAIEQLTLTHNVSVTSTKAYDGTAIAAATGDLTNKVANDAVTLDKAFAFNSKDVSAANQITATTWSITGADAGNYTLPDFAAVTDGVSITAKEITVAAAASPSVTKVYDGNTSAKVDPADYAISGTVSGETLTLTGLTATYNAAGVDATKATCTGFTLADGTNGLAANYNLTTTTFDISAAITARPVTITAKAQTIDYGTAITTDVTQVDVSAATTDTGLVSGHTLDGITLSQSTTSVTNSGIITPSAAIIKSGDADVSANYSVTYATGVLTITGVAYPNKPTAPNVTAAFGQKLSELTPTAVDGGAWSWKNGDTIPTVGNGGYEVTFTPVDTNYAPFELIATVTVTPKALTLTGFAATGREFAPGDTAVSYTAGPLTELVSGFEAVSVVTDSVTASIDSADQGTHDVTLSGILTLTGTDAGNYTLTQPTGITVTITAKPYNASGFTITGVETSYAYTNEAITPIPKINCGTTPLVRDTDYTLSYTDNIAVGKNAKIKIAFAGNYSGSAETTFEITYAALPGETTNTTVFADYDITSTTWSKNPSGVTFAGNPDWTVSTDGTTFGASVTFTEEGTVSKTVYVKDSAGNIYTTTVTYKLDKTDPQISTAARSAAWSSVDQTITLTASDALSGIAGYGLSKGENQQPTTWQESNVLTVTETGSYWAWAKDKAGNTTHFGQSLDQKIDRNAPEITKVDIPTANAQGWHTTAPTVTVSATDTESGGMQYSFDGSSNWQDAHSKTFENGTHLVTIWVKDAVYNIAEQEAFTLNVDTAIPATPTVTGYASGTWTAENVVFTLSNATLTTSGHAKYQVKIGTAGWTDVIGTTVTHSENTVDAGVTYQFRSVNNAGTEGTPSAEITVKRRALDAGTVLDSEANKYADADLTPSGTPNADDWYSTSPVTVTVTKKPNITDSGTSYPADTYYKLDNGSVTKLGGTTISVTGDGNHSLVIWTKDAAGNETTHLTKTIKIDTTAPIASDTLIPSVAAGTWTKDDITVSFTASDSTSGIASVTVSPTGAVTEPTPGNYTFTAGENDTYTVTVTDKAGKTTERTIAIANIDKTVPVISAVTVPAVPTSGWYTGDVTVTVSITEDNLAKWEYSLDNGGTWITGSNTSFVIGANGDYTGKVKVKVTDNAGNETVSAAISVKLDKEKPATPTVTGYASGTWTAENVVFTLSNATLTTSGHAKYQVKIGAADWADVTGTTVTHSENTVDAGVTYQFRSVNNAGTEGTASASITVKHRALDAGTVLDHAVNKYADADLTPSGTPNADDWYSTSPITVTVTKKPNITDSGTSYPADTYYKLDNGSVTKLGGTTISVTGDGNHSLVIWTKDAAGNETTHLTKTIKIDTTAPTITGVTIPSVNWGKENETIHFTAADTTSGVKTIVVKDSTDKIYDVTANKSFVADKNGTYTITVTDHAGKQTAQQVTVTKIDKTAPVITLPTFDGKKWFGATEITAAVIDTAGSGVDTVTVSGGHFALATDIKIAGKFTATEPVANAYTYTIAATDNVGNAASKTVTIKIDLRIDEFMAQMEGLGTGSDFSNLASAKDWYDKQNQIVKNHIDANNAAKEKLEKLNTWIEAKAEAAAGALSDKVTDADTLEEIAQAKKDFDSLPEAAQDSVSPATKDALNSKLDDAKKAQNVIDQMENADKDGATYEEKQSATETYDKLTEDQKKLVPQDKKPLYDSIKADLVAIDAVLDKLDVVKKPYTPATKELIKTAEDAFNTLTQKQKDAFPTAEKAKLDELVTMGDHTQTVETAIGNLGDSPALDALQKAKADYNALTADEKSLIDGTLKAAMDKKYQDKLDKMTADDKAAAEFATQVEEVKNAPTTDKIQQLMKEHDVLSDTTKGKLTDQTKMDYGKLIDDLAAAKKVIDKLDKIDLDTLAPEHLDEVKDTLGKGDASGYDDLTSDQKKLVDEATGGKPGILDKAVTEIADATDKVEKIPGHSEGSQNPDGTPDLGDCDNAGNAGTDNSGTGGHDYNNHRAAIEAAKIAYEKLSDAGRKLISTAAKDKINGEYKALIAYLEYVSTAKTATTTVEVAGLVEKVALPADAVTAGKTLISVEMKDEKPAVMPPVPQGKQETLSVNVKLVAKIFANDTDTDPISTENVQPKSGKKVLVKLLLPSGFKLETLEIWHVKDSGSRSRISDFWLVTEPDGSYAVFEVSSFSHFVFFAEKVPVIDGGGTVTPPKPSIPSTEGGNTTITPPRPKPGTSVAVMPKPDEGYAVDKIVVTDQSGKEIPVKDNGDGTYSYIQPKGKVTIKVTYKPLGFPFTDVVADDWFYDSVKYVYEKGLMQGTAADKFSPYLDTDRGMIVAILWRLEGEPEAKSGGSFPDVPIGAYYAKAVDWAAENGIVKGYSSGRFGPDDLISREQLAAILYRYAQFKKMDASAKGDLSKFSDQPSEWSAESIGWAVGAGIISGKGNGILDPMGKATRAETAKILTNFADLPQK